MSACVDRGHFDGRSPSFHIVLRAEVGSFVQRTLFDAAPIVELYEAPACEHPEAGWQKNILGEMEHVCTFCGREVPEVSNAAR